MAASSGAGAPGARSSRKPPPSQSPDGYRRDAWRLVVHHNPVRSHAAPGGRTPVGYLHEHHGESLRRNLAAPAGKPTPTRPAKNAGCSDCVRGVAIVFQKRYSEIWGIDRLGRAEAEGDVFRDRKETVMAHLLRGAIAFSAGLAALLVVTAAEAQGDGCVSYHHWQADRNLTHWRAGVTFINRCGRPSEVLYTYNYGISTETLLCGIGRQFVPPGGSQNVWLPVLPVEVESFINFCSQEPFTSYCASRNQPLCP